MLEISNIALEEPFSVKNVIFDSVHGIGAFDTLHIDPEQNFIAFIPPKNFLDLTPKTTGQKKDIEIFLDKEFKKSNRNNGEFISDSIAPPFLEIAYGSCSKPCIANHEGRHRTKAFMKEGFSLIPVMIMMTWRDENDDVSSVETPTLSEVRRLKQMSLFDQDAYAKYDPSRDRSYKTHRLDIKAAAVGNKLYIFDLSREEFAKQNILFEIN